jgi:hypothetical protein
MCARWRRGCAWSPARAGQEAGQATPLVLAIIALAVVVLLALVPLARAAADRAQAATAADAAALAGAAEGEEAAREVAAANGAALVTWRASGADVWVAVTVGKARAVAKARRS